jgi:hypothetical protein
MKNNILSYNLIDLISKPSCSFLPSSFIISNISFSVAAPAVDTAEFSGDDSKPSSF